MGIQVKPKEGIEKKERKIGRGKKKEERRKNFRAGPRGTRPAHEIRVEHLQNR